MAKIYGLFGSMTGKVADTVMSVRNGEQIVRKYQPVVFNPSTEAQVANRARMKLMSQLSAVMAPVIAMRREGNVSARNMFVKTNYGLTSYQTDSAQIQLARVKLTRSVVGLPEIRGSRGENGISAYVTVGSGDLSRVVYVAFEKQTDYQLRYLGSATATSAGTSGAGFWPATLPQSQNEVVVYAYGIRDNSTNARTVFGNMTVPSAEQIARLIVTRTLTEGDVTLTETRSTSVPAAA